MKLIKLIVVGVVLYLTGYLIILGPTELEI